MRIGVIGIQGDVSEHIAATRAAIEEMGVRGEVLWVRRADAARDVDGVIIPGGESTTISRLMKRHGLWDVVRERALSDDLAVMGTCAGSIILAKEVENAGDRVASLGLMDIAVRRNAYGRQRESFETPLKVKGMDEPFPAVFIRAPAITRVWGDAEVLATLGDDIVMAREGRMLALTFHPELTGDTRIHRMFLGMVER